MSVRVPAAAAVVLLSFTLAAGAADKTFNLTCEKLKVRITVDVDGSNIWRGKTAKLQIGDREPQTLNKQEAGVGEYLYSNGNFEFHNFRKITTLSDKKKKNAFYDCDWK